MHRLAPLLTSLVASALLAAVFIFTARTLASVGPGGDPVPPLGALGGITFPATNVSRTGTADSATPFLAADGRGNLHLAWVEGNGSAASGVIYYARSLDKGISWSQVAGLTPLASGTQARRPAMVADGSGSLHVVWEDKPVSTASVVKWLTLGADGSVPGSGLLTSGTVWSESPQVAVDANGRLVAVWIEKPATGPNAIKGKSSTGGSFSAAADLPGMSAGATFQNLALAVDGTTLHLAWSQATNGGSAEIVYSSLASGASAWTQAENVSKSASFPSTQPALAIVNGAVHVVWVEGTNYPNITRVQHSRRDPAGVSWSSPVVLTPSTTFASGPSIAAEPAGLHVAWGEKVGISNRSTLAYARSTDNGATWPLIASEYTGVGSPSSSASAPRLLRDADGNVMVAWQEGGVVAPPSYPPAEVYTTMLQRASAQTVQRPVAAGAPAVVPSSDGAIVLNVPAGAVAQPITITIEPLAQVPPPPADSVILPVRFRLTKTSTDTFSQEITITVRYSDLDVAGLDESKLRIAFYDTDVTPPRWTFIAESKTTRDPANNLVHGRVDHFTDFALFGDRYQLFVPVSFKGSSASP